MRLTSILEDNNSMRCSSILEEDISMMYSSILQEKASTLKNFVYVGVEDIYKMFILIIGENPMIFLILKKKTFMNSFYNREENCFLRFPCIT